MNDSMPSSEHSQEQPSTNAVAKPKRVRPKKSDIATQTATPNIRKQTPGDYPIDRKALRDRMLEAAGVGTEQQIQLIRLAVAKYQEKLKAKRSQVVSYLGAVTEVVEMDDNAAQLRAADAIIELTGVKPQSDASGGRVKVSVELVLPEWARPAEVIDVDDSYIQHECPESSKPA